MHLLKHLMCAIIYLFFMFYLLLHCQASSYILITIMWVSVLITIFILQKENWGWKEEKHCRWSEKVVSGWHQNTNASILNFKHFEAKTSNCHFALPMKAAGQKTGGKSGWMSESPSCHHVPTELRYYCQ